jgi:predicted metal-binding membrane protein
MTEVQRLTRIAPAILLIGVAAVCWVITAQRMDGMDMGPGTDLGELGWFAGVWAAMMAAMMLPSLVPMAAAFERRDRVADQHAPRHGVTTAAFVLGCLLAWVGAGLVGYGVLQGIRALDIGVLAWNEGGRYIAGGVIVAAAAYELTPAKTACLLHCRDPRLLVRRWREGLSGALSMGFAHGGRCIGCSWALMAALFALGAMSVGWMILVAALIAIEELLPWRTPAVWVTALLLVVLGVAVTFSPSDVPGLTIPG